MMVYPVYRLVSERFRWHVGTFELVDVTLSPAWVKVAAQYYSIGRYGMGDIYRVTAESAAYQKIIGSGGNGVGLVVVQHDPSVIAKPQLNGGGYQL